MEDDILIDNYLKGLLSEDEQQAFLERLSADVAFNEAFKLEEQLFNALNADSWSYVNHKSTEVQAYKKVLADDDLQNLKKTLEQVNSEFNSKASPRFRTLYYYLAAASVVVLLGFQLFFNQGPSNQELYKDYVALNELPSFVSRADETNILSKAQKLFEDKKYEDALAIFQSQSTDSMDSGNLSIYLGITQIELGRYTAAEKTFDELINSDLIDSEKGYWYKALLYLRQNRVNDAKGILGRIVDENLFNNTKAKELLKALD